MKYILFSHSGPATDVLVKKSVEKLGVEMLKYQAFGAGGSPTQAVKALGVVLNQTLPAKEPVLVFLEANLAQGNAKQNFTFDGFPFDLYPTAVFVFFAQDPGALTKVYTHPRVFKVNKSALNAAKLKELVDSARALLNPA